MKVLNYLDRFFKDPIVSSILWIICEFSFISFIYRIIASFNMSGILGLVFVAIMILSIFVTAVKLIKNSDKIITKYF